MTTNYGSPINGTLTGSTAIVNAVGIQLPATLVLNSTAAGKAIAFSLDGTNYYPSVTPTGSISGQIYYVLNFPVSKIEFTGAANDTYSIL